MFTEWASFMAFLETTELREYLLHPSEDVTEKRRLVDPHATGSKAEPEPQRVVKVVAMVSAVAVLGESILLVVIVVIVIIVGHAIEKGVPGTDTDLILFKIHDIQSDWTKF